MKNKNPLILLVPFLFLCAVIAALVINSDRIKPSKDLRSAVFRDRVENVHERCSGGMRTLDMTVYYQDQIYFPSIVLGFCPFSDTERIEKLEAQMEEIKNEKTKKSNSGTRAREALKEGE